MPFIQNHTGEIFALLTAIFWTITALSFESASLQIGSIAVNIIRLVFGFILISIYVFFSRGQLLPLDASTHNWFWLSLSGFVGFVFGDLLLLESFVLIGSRIAMLVMAIVPPLTALCGRIILHEKLGLFSMLGMIITLSGITVALISRDEKKIRLKKGISIKGLLFASGGAIGQALGLVLSKKGIDGYNAFAATQIRILTGIFGFVVLATILRLWPKIASAFRNKNAIIMTSIGSFFGPFLGVSFSLLAIIYTKTGIASTIMAIVPVLIIPPSIFLFKQKVTWPEILGACISVVGISVFFIL